MKQRTFNAGRLSALSDGVFAIAMTLLVLDLKLPQVDSGSGHALFARGLLEQAPRFASWFLSFVILCRLWIIHHAMLVDGDTRSRGFMGWNFLFLGAISFLPYPTSLLSEHHDQSLSVVFFSVVLGAAGVALRGMSHSQLRHLGATARPSQMVTAAARISTVLLTTAAVASGIAFLSPKIGALVWLGFPLTALLIQHRRAGHHHPAAHGPPA